MQPQHFNKGGNKMKTSINQLSNGKIEITKGEVLNPAQLSALKWYCLNNGVVKFLSKSQISQLAEFMLSEANKYPSSHSMKFTIMRDFTYACIIKKFPKEN